MVSIAVLVGVALTMAVLIWPPLANAKLWRATITPLASIIGSGFLVLGPILDISYGAYAPLVIAGLCLTAYLFGWAVRFNIQQINSVGTRSPAAEAIDKMASAVLAFAYVISVAYYLNLFGAFGVRLTAVDDSFHARLLTTGVFLVVLSVGWLRGFSALERMEQISVGLKLSIIAGFLVGLAIHFGQTAQAGELVVHKPNISGWQAVIIAAGLLVTIQGFETSRYLGDSYDAATRIKSMKVAQWISTVIYLFYILLLTYAFKTKLITLNETAIIDLMIVVAPILPALLIAAALSAQFSAAVADTTSSGGLICELLPGRINTRIAYLILVVCGIFLTWTANVFEIISYASRAFAAYYALQACIAALYARAGGAPVKASLFVAIAVLAAFAALFGAAVE